MKKCRLCNQQVPNGKTHYCPKRSNAPIRVGDGDDGGDFLISVAIGAATDSAIIGGLVGGNITGGIIGDMFDGDLDD